MSSALIWNNLMAYSLQIGLLVGLAAFLPAILRFRLPGARLVFLQVLLAACLLLPAIQPWKRAPAGNGDGVTTSVVVVERGSPGGGPGLPWPQLGLVLLAAGFAIRLGLLGVGFVRLARYRRNASSLDATGRCPTLVSDEISSPVTFGFLRPVVLLPASFSEMEPARRQAILCHEFLHVERRDWVLMVAEEVVRAIFWFHPAIWWVLGEIQLAREQAVDREVVRRTQAREEYVDALLEIAGADLQQDLAPAPLFLRRRHLKQRVVSIFKEVHMSRTRWMSRLVLGLTILVTACWLVTGAFPLVAEPQSDAPGVSVDIGAATLMHRAAVAYPEAARRKGVQGTVMLEATLDAAGNVTDAHVLSGPEDLRRAALDSLLQWHFANGAAGATRQVSVTFQLPDSKPAAQATGYARSSAFYAGRTVKAVSVLGLSDQARRDLLSALPVHEGDTITADTVGRVEQAVKGFDEHLRVAVIPGASGEASIQVTAPDYVPPATPGKIRVGGGVMQAKLISQARPVYPPEAKAARIQGVVRLSAVIGKDGTVQNLEVISGHPLLVPAALEAVQQWRYETTLLNGEPVEVMTQIDINFTLSQ